MIYILIKLVSLVAFFIVLKAITDKANKYAEKIKIKYKEIK